LAAVKQLKCNLIPTALVDYDNPKITIQRWFRVFSGAKISHLAKDIDRLNPVKVSKDECEKGLLERVWHSTVEDQRLCFAFPTQKTDPCDMLIDSNKIEMAARKNSVDITYQDTKGTGDARGPNLVMSTIKIEKEEVVANVGRGRLFPPKSTRHLVPSRPLGAGVPLDWLRDVDFPRAQARYIKCVGSRTIKRLPEGSRIGSRRYLEEIFLFE